MSPLNVGLCHEFIFCFCGIILFVKRAVTLERTNWLRRKAPNSSKIVSIPAISSVAMTTMMEMEVTPLGPMSDIYIFSL